MTGQSRKSFWTIRGVISALPDFLTASVFFYVWLFAPERPYLVSTMMLVMLIEFLVVHSAGMLGFIVYGDLPKPTKTKSLLGLGAFYALFAFAFSYAFEALWPLFWVAWLLMSKLAVIWFGSDRSAAQKDRLTAEWAAGVAFYVLGAFFTLLPIIPRLSLESEFVAGLNLEGSGVWIDEPHRVVAFGVLYFTAIGVTKMALLRSK